MTLTLTRADYRKDGIFSELTDEKGKTIAVCLEHSYDGLPKLYNGTFRCVRGTHRLHNNIPFETFEITGVKGHSGVLFHVGNYNADSSGCCLLGTDIKDMPNGTRMITHSMIAFSKFMAKLEKLNEFTLIVKS